MKEKNSISSKFLNSNYKLVNNLNYFMVLLRPVGFLYGQLMRLRAWLYRKGFFSTIKISAHVISVGNLTMGGSGKTPVVIYLSQLLLKNSYRPAVISRGYGGKATGVSNVVSDGEKILLNAKDSGDEPRLIAETVPGIVVVTGTKRADPCKHATDNFKCDTIIMDDAFQHLAVDRDINLVLFNATTLNKNMHILI